MHDSKSSGPGLHAVSMHALHRSGSAPYNVVLTREQLRAGLQYRRRFCHVCIVKCSHGVLGKGSQGLRGDVAAPSCRHTAADAAQQAPLCDPRISPPMPVKASPAMTCRRDQSIVRCDIWCCVLVADVSLALPRTDVLIS